MYTVIAMHLNQEGGVVIDIKDQSASGPLSFVEFLFKPNADGTVNMDFRHLNGALFGEQRYYRTAGPPVK